MMTSSFSRKSITGSKKRSRAFARYGSYFILISMAIVMVLPLLWLINGSLQPLWQINASPVIWIPREWNTVPAGDTGRDMLLWLLGEEGSDEKQEVVNIGSRRYITVVDVNQMDSLISVPKDELSDPTTTDVGGVPLNIREWSTPERVREVVAVLRDPENDDNLVVVEAANLDGIISQIPLDQVNRGDLEGASVSGHDLSTRLMEDGRQFFVLGPEVELAVVGSPDIVDQAELIQSSRLGKKEFLDVGETQLSIYPVEGKPEDFRAISVVEENWQPLMAQSDVAEYGFVTTIDQLSEESETREFNNILMNVRTYTPPEGGEPFEVSVLIPGSYEFLVIPVEHMDKLYAGQISKLIEPGSENIKTITYRVQEDFEQDGRVVPSAIIGELQELALIVPSSVVEEAFDIQPDQLERSTRIKLNFLGYQRVLNLKLSGVPFWRFFINSGYVVLMNTIGHLISCTLVAYGFARLRAPGKDILFVILLGTMMVPYTIIALPTYIIFRDMGLLGTMVPLWIRSFFGNAFLIFLLRQFFMAIPYELDEAAILDGASRFQVLTKVIIPLSRPALATMGIFTFWWYWNAFLDPLIYVNQQKHFTITLALNSFNRMFAGTTGYYDRILAGSVLTLLPMVIIFIFAQRYFIEGIQMQGLKR
jgi:ABC-type glycerol-3-phosphate transport system permease component